MGISEEDAKSLQDRLGNVVAPSQAVEPSASAPSIEAVAIPARVHRPPVIANNRQEIPEPDPVTNLETSLTRVLNEQNEQQAEPRPRYLLLCISTVKSVVYCPIDVTHITHDQFLFQAIRDTYNAAKNRSSWSQRIIAVLSQHVPALARLKFKGVELFIPRYAELVSFFLMPIPKGHEEDVGPFGLEPSYPPEDEVWAQRWEYRPCPKSFTSFHMTEAFVTIMLQPGHAYRDDAWLQLFPKKLHSELKYKRGGNNVGWGIHIVEGVNAAAVIYLGLQIAVGSGVFGVLYSSISKDTGAGFTIAAWIATVAALLVASTQLNARQ